LIYIFEKLIVSCKLSSHNSCGKYAFHLLDFGVFSVIPPFRLVGFGVIFRRSAIPRFHLLGIGVIFRRSVILPFRRSITPAFRVTLFPQAETCPLQSERPTSQGY